MQPTPPPKAPAPRITLTGITTILGMKLALLKVQVPASSSGPARTDFCTLTEGQQSGGLEVIAINEREGTARIAYSGEAITLVLDPGSPTAPPAPPPPTL